MAIAPEVRAVEEAHRAAQAHLGIAGALLAIRYWGDVSPTQPAQTAGAWLVRSIRMIMAIRRKSRRLAIAYYQLARALETGYTLGLPEYSDNPREVTMSGLRQQYLDLLLEISALSTEPSSTDDPDEEWFESEVRELPQDDPEGSLNDLDLGSYIQELLDATEDGDSQVEVDDFDWPEGMTEEEVDNAFLRILEDDVVEAANLKVEQLRDSEDPAGEVILRIETGHRSSGNVGAGKVDKFGVDAGRDVINYAQNNDERVMAVARGLGPNPCPFCAMLASRGFVYKSRSGAVTTRRAVTRAGNELGDTVRSYHDNCHCYPIVRWIDASELPELNQYFQDMWPVVTAGYSGVDALNAWRRWMYAERRQALRDNSAA